MLLPACLLWLVPFSSVGQTSESGRRVARAQQNKESRGARRYISAQAYYHALRAALAEARGDLPEAADELQLALVYDHESLHLTLELGRVSLALDRMGRARKMAARARQIDPARLSVALLSAAVAKAEGALRRAERILRRAERRERHEVRIGLALAAVLREQGRLDDAVPVLRRAADRLPQATEALEALAEVERAAGRWPRVVRALERAVRRAPHRAPLLRRLTDAYERTGQLADALARWDLALDRQPGDLELRTRRAEVRRLLGLESEADRAGIVLASHSRAARTALARSMASSGAFGSAVEVLDALARSGALEPELALVRGRALAALGQRDRALAAFGKIPTEPRPTYVAARVAMANALEAAGRGRRAQQALLAALRVAADSPVLVARLAEVHLAADRPKEALRLADGAMARGVAARGLTLVWARAKAKLEGAEAAVEAVRARLAEGRLSRADALYAQGRLHMDAGQPDAARRVLSAAARLAPDDPETLLAAARAALARGQTDEGLRLARRALTLTPRDPQVLVTLGRAYLADGDDAHARTFLGRAARLSPRDREIMKSLQSLDVPESPP